MWDYQRYVHVLVHIERYGLFSKIVTFFKIRNYVWVSQLVVINVGSGTKVSVSPSYHTTSALLEDIKLAWWVTTEFKVILVSIIVINLNIENIIRDDEIKRFGSQ